MQAMFVQDFNFRSTYSLALCIHSWSWKCNLAHSVNHHHSMAICAPDELGMCGPAFVHYSLAIRVDSNKKYELIYSNMHSVEGKGRRTKKKRWQYVKVVFTTTAVGWHVFHIRSKTFYVHIYILGLLQLTIS